MEKTLPIRVGGHHPRSIETETQFVIKKFKSFSWVDGGESIGCTGFNSTKWFHAKSIKPDNGTRHRLAIADNIIGYKYPTGSCTVLEFETHTDALAFWSSHCGVPVNSYAPTNFLNVGDKFIVDNATLFNTESVFYKNDGEVEMHVEGFSRQYLNGTKFDHMIRCTVPKLSHAKMMHHNMPIDVAVQSTRTFTAEQLYALLNGESMCTEIDETQQNITQCILDSRYIVKQ